MLLSPLSLLIIQFIQTNFLFLLASRNKVAYIKYSFMYKCQIHKLIAIISYYLLSFLIYYFKIITKHNNSQFSLADLNFSSRNSL